MSGDLPELQKSKYATDEATGEAIDARPWERRLPAGLSLLDLHKVPLSSAANLDKVSDITNLPGLPSSAQAKSNDVSLLNSESKSSLSPLQNLASVYGEIIPRAPGAVASSLLDDWQNHKLETAGKMAIAGGIGLGSAVLLARSPVLAKSLLAGIGMGSTVLATGSALNFSAEVVNADSAQALQKLSDRGSQSLGRLGADLIETTPAMLLGAKAGLGLSSRVPSLESLATSVRDNLEFRVRSLVPDRLHYIGMDGKTMTGMQNGGGANLFRAGEEMLQSTPWRGVEDARLFKMNAEGKLKISSRLPGTESETILGRRADYAFHTHEARVVPTSSDYTSVRNGGIIGIPKEGIITFYEGRGEQAKQIAQLIRDNKPAAAATAAEQLHQGGLPAIVLDTRNKLAVGVNLEWLASENRLVPTSFRAINYEKAVSNLSSWNGKINYETMASSRELLVQPGLRELIGKIVQH